MLHFKDISNLSSVLSTIYQHVPGPEGSSIFRQILEENLKFTSDQAKRYSSWVLTSNSKNSAAFVSGNASKLLGTWSSGSSQGSAGNLLVSSTESWIFFENLTYEIKNESYEGYVSPFGGGYSRPRSRSRRGIWAPSDLPGSKFSIVTIDGSGLCEEHSVEWANGEQTLPFAMRLDGRRFGKM